MSTRLSSLILFSLVTLAAPSAWALGVDNGYSYGDADGDRFERAALEVSVDGDFAKGVLTIEVTPDDRGGVWVNFPLPPDSVIYKAEYSHGDGSEWIVAETTGRKQGEAAYGAPDTTAKLLLQDVGKDFYRLRLGEWHTPETTEDEASTSGDVDDSPLVDGNAAASLTRERVYARIHYAQPLEVAPDGARLLRLAMNSPREESDTIPSEGLSATIDFDDSHWQAVEWLGASDGKDVGMIQATMAFDGQLIEDHLLRLTPNQNPSTSALSYFPNDERFEAHTIVRWMPSIQQQPEPRRIIFILDRSGSMNGYKLETSKAMLKRALDGISKQDRFSIVAFDSNAESWSGTLEGVGKVEAAKKWVDGISDAGSTNVDDAFQEAASIARASDERHVDILLITDGRPTAGRTGVSGIIDRFDRDMKDTSYRVFALGIGGDLDQGYLDELTDGTGGLATYALADSSLEAQFMDLYARTQDGGLREASATLSVGGQANYHALFPGDVVTIAHEGSLASMMAVELDGTTSRGAAVTYSDSVAAPSQSSVIAAPLAAKAWANQLEQQIDEDGETPALAAEAVTLARTYGIVTRYSSMIAFADESEYQVQGIEQVERNEAGISVTPLQVQSQIDESRIGGDGTYAGAGGVYADSAGSGCYCSSTRERGVPAGGALLFFGVLVFLRRGR